MSSDVDKEIIRARTKKRRKFEDVLQLRLSRIASNPAAADRKLRQMLAALERALKVMCLEGENDLEEWQTLLVEIEAAIVECGGEI